METDRFGFGDPDGEDSAPVVEQPEVEVEDGLGDVEEYEAEDTTEYEVEEDGEEPPSKEVPPKQVKKLYSPDEIKSILREKDFSGIDTSRLSEEGQAVMKAMQAGLTPKLQESAALRKELQEMRGLIEKSIPKPKPKDIYEAYDQDPEETMTFVNSRIQALINEGADLHDIEKVREVREQLRERRARKLEEQATGNSFMQQSVNALLQAVPDINEKQVALRDFAIEYMNMTPEEVAYETSIQQKGMDAVKMIARINAAYDKLNAGSRAKAKAKTKTTRVEKPGAGFEKQSTTKNDAFKQAKKSGNWKAYFMDMEE